MSTIQNEAICCPPLDVAQWEDAMHQWNNKIFIRDRVKTFFFMPLNFGTAMRRLDIKVRAADAAIPDFLCLSDHTSKWNMDLYLAVNKEVPQADMAKMSGTFYSRVYEGPFKDTGIWCKDYESIVESKGMKIIKMYMWYTTCPKCAKKYGKNYTVIISEVN